MNLPVLTLQGNPSVATSGPSMAINESNFDSRKQFPPLATGGPSVENFESFENENFH